MALTKMLKTSSSLLSIVCLLLVLQRAIGQEPVLINRDEASLRSFADSLTNEIYTNENDCSSTWGVSMMLDLLRPGSGSATDTLLQLCDVVGLCGPEDELLWNSTVVRLTSRYDGSCMRFYEGECLEVLPTVRVANSVWIDTASQLDPDYQPVVGEYLQKTDFDSDLAGGVVNDWVNASTLGLIDSIIDEGPIDYILLAVNSIYFKAAWQKPFPEWNTNMDLFYPDPTSAGEDAHFMHLVDYFPYSGTELEGYQVLQLPYVNSDLSMIIALPLDINDVTVMNVSSESIVDTLPELQTTRVAIALPKFVFESEYEESLKDALISLGLTAPFMRGFCGMFEGVCRALDLVKQKTYIEVNEEGTIAAAVTVGGIERSLPVDTPVLFQADRPFRFFIYDETEDLVLFEGRVGLPAIPEDSMAQLEAKHSDANFWTSNFGVVPEVPEGFESSSSSSVTRPPQKEPTVAPDPTSKTEKPQAEPTMATMEPSTAAPSTQQMMRTRTTEGSAAVSGSWERRKRLVWTVLAGVVAILAVLFDRF